MREDSVNVVVAGLDKATIPFRCYSAVTRSLVMPRNELFQGCPSLKYPKWYFKYIIKARIDVQESANIAEAQMKSCWKQTKNKQLSGDNWYIT